MTTPIAYKFRAEFSHDCLLIRNLIQPWVIDWQEIGAILKSPNTERHMRIPDVDVTFTLNSTAPSLPELRWLFSQVIDLHVPVESIQLAEHYTGGRNSACEVLQTPRVLKMSHLLVNLKKPSADWMLYWHTCLRLSI